MRRGREERARLERAQEKKQRTVLRLQKEPSNPPGTEKTERTKQNCITEDP
jgi:hypothetical protein